MLSVAPETEVTQVGAVITFPPHITADQVRCFLSEWQGDLIKDDAPVIFEDDIRVGTFNPEHGKPVFYVP